VCHGRRSSGTTLGGISLLRSQVVLSDQDGELMQPSHRGRTQERRACRAINMTTARYRRARDDFINSVVATEKGQGAPRAPGVEKPPTALVGRPPRGQGVLFASHVRQASCHSVMGDLQGYGTKFPDGQAAQNRWVSAAGGGRGTRGVEAARRTHEQ